ncbi:signal transduction protein [Bacillus sp. MRMR6]|nr:signal transduction protein [Bacillus sp. MRMR6]
MRKYFLFSIKSTINTLYLPIIIIFIFIIGWGSAKIATDQIEENAYKNVNDTVFQTKNYLEYMLFDVFQQLVALARDPKVLSLMVTEDSEIKPQSYIEIDKNLQNIYSRKSVILDSVLIDLNQSDFLLYRSYYEPKPILAYEDYFSKFEGSKEGYYWENIHHDRFFNSNEKVMSVFQLIESDSPARKGIILFNLKTSFFEQVLSKSLIGENGYLALVSPDGVFRSKQVLEKYKADEQTLQSFQNLEQEKGQFSFTSKEGEKMIAIYDTIDVNNWKLAAIFPEAEILNNVNYIKHFTLVLIVLLVLSAIFLTNIVGKYISKPFKQMAQQMDKINDKNLELNYELSGPDEMKVLHNGFNELIFRINALMDQILLEQEEKRQLEFAIMHAQINPHFLYNTLYSIKGLCDMGLNKDASQMVSELSSFFRIGISKGKEILTIKEEIEHIQHYLYIQEMRYGDDFSYELDVDIEILSYNIIKLSLQPLIENAIYHGVKQRRGRGKICVRGYQAKDTIHFEVADNGHGIEIEKLKDIVTDLETSFKEKKKFIGVGLKSVNERIKIHFGLEYGLTITSEPDKGTVVSIIIPKTRGEIS